MTKEEAAANFGKIRKRTYASINGTKGNLMNLKASSILSIKEKELLQDVINGLEKLRLEFVHNYDKAIITAKQTTI
jgi:hypothetical protein